MGTVIRPATVADARAIAALQLRAWWRAYQDVVDPHHLQAWDEESRTAHWMLILSPATSTTLVAEVAAAIHGVATVGPDRQDDADRARGEVYALYVDPAAQGAGLGSALLGAAQDTLRSTGCSGAVLRVMAANGLARRFYERHGWSAVAGSEHTGSWRVPVIRYQRSL